MEKNKSAQIIPLGWQKKDGIWLSPEEAVHYFRNGKGIALGTLLNNLRKGKLDDISMRDAFGWWIFIPNYLVEQTPLKAA